MSADMVEGYIDGGDLNNPEPGPNRSPAYRHGFANGRDDANGRPRASAATLRAQAAAIEQAEQSENNRLA